MIMEGAYGYEEDIGVSVQWSHEVICLELVEQHISHILCKVLKGPLAKHKVVGDCRKRDVMSSSLARHLLQRVSDLPETPAGIADGLHV